MRSLTKLSLVALSCAALALVACGDDDDSPPPLQDGKGGSAGTAAGGTSAGGTSAGGEAGTSAAGAGGEAGTSAAGAGGEAGTSAAGAGGEAGTSAAGAGGEAGTSAAGAGGATGGAGGEAAAGNGGAAGSTSDPQADLAGCTFAGATDGTGAATAKVAVDGTSFSYTPKCLKVKAGTKVTFEGSSGVHPLRPFTSKGTLPNPIPSTSEASVDVTFATAGAYGYFCQNHGGDGNTSGMVGAVYVVP